MSAHHSTGPTVSLTAESALGQLGGHGLVFASAPGSYAVLRQNDGVLDGELPTNTFRLSATSGDAELRWVRTSSEGGRSAIVSDPAEADGVSTADHLEYIWGEVERSDEDSTVVSAAAFGTREIPVTAGTSGRLALRVRRHLATDQYGNVHEVDRRIVGIEPVSEPDDDRQDNSDDREGVH